MRSKFRSSWDKLNFKVESIFRKHKYTKRGKIRIKKMNGGYDCGKEYNTVVIPFWKRFGYKPKKLWYQIYCDREKRLIRGICQMTYIMGILFLILAICNSGVLRKISVITICGFMI